MKSGLFLHSLYTMLKRQFLLQISLFLPAIWVMTPGYSQNTLRQTQVSWQQRVDHRIHVRLDERQKMLHCEEEMAYTNNSPGALTEIHMHIWPNAFKNRRTAYGQEAVVKGNKKFFNVSDAEAGWLDSLKFTVNGQPATFRYHEQFSDIIILSLPAPLQPGSTAKISTPFRVKIPWLFSRMGYNENLLSITQWYPKPAVYDANGWNTFPYAEQGEYYSEFGTYSVSLDVPANYRVAATGRLQDSAELAWLAELAEGGDEPDLRSGRKTLTYVQENVSDFAWFANPDFKVKQGSTTLPGGRKVTTYAFYTEQAGRVLPGGKKLPVSQKIDGGKIIEAIDKGLTYYSRRVGVYPYDYCTVVIGQLQGAGGMEYPMITICTDASEGTIIHEVGHNWFQGMLGSQEREYPWMDESINTFYQNQAEGKSSEELSPGDKLKPTGTYAGFRLSHDFGVYQCGHLHSASYTSINYGTIVYGINPQRFQYLQEYLGRTRMDTCMHRYFRKWQYRHPLPGDMKAVFEKESGEDLSWFFDHLISGPAPDYAISSVKKKSKGYQVKINNKSGYDLPARVQWRFGTRKEGVWVHGDTTLFIPVGANAVSVNATGNLPERNLANNDAELKGLFKTWGNTVVGFPNLYKRGENRVWFLPWLFSWNRYDGWMPGLVLSNISFPRRNWEWWAVPMYGLRSSTVTGLAGIRRNLYHGSGLLTKTELTLNLRRFSFEGSVFEAPVVAYNRGGAKAVMTFRRRKAWVAPRLEAEYSLVRLDRTDYLSPQYDSNNVEIGQVRRFDRRVWENDLLRISFIRESGKKLLPAIIRADFFMGGYKGTLSPQTRYNPGSFMMGNIEAAAYIPYPNKSKKEVGLKVKGWASVMTYKFDNGQSGKFVLPVSAPRGNPNDFSFSQTMIARSAEFRSGDGIWSNMLTSANGIRMFPNLNTNQWVAGLSVQSHILPVLPIQVFADVAMAPDFDQPLWAGGITWWQHIGIHTTSEISLPLFYSSTFRDYVSLQGLKWYQLFNFRVNLDLNDPFALVRTILN